MIYFKTEKILKEFPSVDNRAKIVLFTFAGLAWMEKEYHVIVTQCLRTPEMDKELGIDFTNDPHLTGRAIDCNFCKSGRGNPRIIDDTYAVKISVSINKIIIHGVSTYPTVLYHDQGLGKHFHLQVNRNNATMIVAKAIE